MASPLQFTVTSQSDIDGCATLAHEQDAVYERNQPYNFLVLDDRDRMDRITRHYWTSVGQEATYNTGVWKFDEKTTIPLAPFEQFLIPIAAVPDASIDGKVLKIGKAIPVSKEVRVTPGSTCIMLWKGDRSLLHSQK